MRVAGIGLLAAGMAVLVVMPQNAAATDIRLTIENLQPEDGFYFSPVWLGFHDGGFDLFDVGSPASTEVQSVAETGNAGPLQALLASMTNGDATARYGTTITSPGGFPALPIFDPGESVTVDLSVPNAASNRYLSFASMVVPSNDAFFGNGSPMMFQVFDALGNLAGPLTIEIRGMNVYDSGTEVNDMMGAAFSVLGGTDSDENGVVQMHPGLAGFVGTGTADGTIIGSGIDGAELVARIHVAEVPEPHTAVLLLSVLAAAGVLLRRNRSR